MKKIVSLIVSHEIQNLPIFLKTIGIKEGKTNISFSSNSSDYLWLHNIRGNGKLIIENNIHMISEDSCIFISAGVPFKFSCTQQISKIHFITFNGNYLSSLIKIFNIKKISILEAQNTIHLEMLFNELLSLAGCNRNEKEIMCSSLLYNFIIELSIYAKHSSLKNAKYKKLSPVLNYINNNYNMPITLTDMASVISVTSQHLCRLFKETYKMRPFEYLNKLRIQKAKELLISNKDITLKEICKITGYNNISYFCSQFKQFEGTTPHKFKTFYSSPKSQII